MTTPGGPIDIALQLDATGYVSGIQQASSATEAFQASVLATTRQQTLLQRAVGTVSPFRAFAAAQGAATASAAAQEQRLSQLAATSAVTGQSAAKLTREMNNLAREFPIGQRGAEAVVQAVQKMGAASGASERKIGQLSKQFVQLGGATGESAEQLAQGMGRFQRAFGNVTLDTSKISKANDALTTLTKNSGTSATGVLGFANTIAPLARQAGISSTAVLGISNAFNKMGEDGYTAANAITKVITDLNRSVRDGSEEMNTYASIVGKTREEFEALYKANPAQALGLVTKSLASEGPQGQRNLERIGLDGVRTSRVLTGLAQQGGLQGEIDAALRGSGTGNTAKASGAAFGGLNDQIEKSAASAEQLAIALGKPLLPLAKLSATLSGMFTTGAAKAVGGEYKGVSAGEVLGVAGAAYALYKTGTALGVGRTLVTSQIARAPVAGLVRAGFGREGGLMQRIAAPLIRASNEGRLGQQVDPRTGRVLMQADGVTPRTQLAGRIANRIMGDTARLAAGSGATPAAQRPEVAGNRGTGVMANARFWGSQSLRLWSNATRDLIAQGNTADPTYRRTLLAPTPGSEAERAGTQMRAGFTGAGAAMRQLNFAPLLGGIANAATVTNNWSRTIQASQGPYANLMRSVSALVAPFGTAAKAGVQLTGSLLGAARAAATSSVGMAAGRGVKNMAGMFLNPTMIALLGGGFAVSRMRGVDKRQKEETEEFSTRSIMAGADKYRESLSLAGESTLTMAERVQAVTKSLNMAVTSIDQARRITDSDVSAAKDTQDDVVRSYAGNAEQIAAQISALNTGGLDPQSLNAVKVDLLRQFDRGFVEDILGSVVAPETAQGRRDAAVGARPAGQAAALMQGAQAAALPTSGAGTYGSQVFTNDAVDQRQFERVLEDEGVVAGLGFAANRFGAGVRGMLGQDPGSRFNDAEVDKTSQNFIDASVESNKQIGTNQRGFFGNDFAQQSQFRDANEVMAEAVKTNNADIIAQTSQQLSQALGGKKARTTVDADEIEKAGGFIQALAKENGTFRRQFDTATEAGVTLSGDGLTGRKQLSNEGRLGVRFGGVLGQYFDNTKAEDSSANRALAAAVESPGDRSKFRDAVEEMTTAALQGGASLLEVGQSANNLANRFDSTLTQSQIAAAVRQRTAAIAQSSAPFNASGTIMAFQAENAAQTLSTLPRTPDADEERGRQEDILRQSIAGMLDQQKQFASQMRAAEVQRTRMEEDFQLQRNHQAEDFNTQRARSDEDFGIQRTRAVANFERQLARTEEDFQLQRARSEEDFYRGRGRAQRDFNRQMSRMAEDGAKSLMDPYQRIQTQPVWDTQSLALNMGKQLQAVTDQIANLGTLRRRGLSQAVIDMLGLSSPDKAQQLARIVADTASDASLVGTLNKQGASRTKATGRLQEEDVSVRRSREDFGRSRRQELEDFQRSQDRQAKDYRKGLRRNRQDFNRTMGEQAADYAKQMTRAEADQQKMLNRQNKQYAVSLARMGEDLRMAQQEFNAGFEELQKATTDAMAGKQVDWDKLMVRGIETTTTKMTAVINKYKQMLEDAGMLGSFTLVPAAQASGPPSFSRNGQVEGTGARGGSGLMGVMGSGRVSSEFGQRNGRLHAGIDIAAPTGTPVLAYMDGTVAFAGSAGGYGTAVYLDHGDGRTTRYGHLSLLGVQAGKQVRKGQTIALSGNTGRSTGPHLHFEKRVNGQPYNPRSAPFALGGIVTQPTEALIGEAGSREAVIPLNAQGVDVLASAMTQFITDAEARMMSTAGARTHITYVNESHEYDNRVVVESATVVSQDPDDMARKLEAKARRDNLVGGPRRR